MADANKDRAPKKVPDAWASDKADWENITIPKLDVNGRLHHSIWDNHYEFLPGESYVVPPVVAKSVRERLNQAKLSFLKLNSSDQDLRHIRAEMVL